MSELQQHETAYVLVYGSAAAWAAGKAAREDVHNVDIFWNGPMTDHDILATVGRWMREVGLDTYLKVNLEPRYLAKDRKLYVPVPIGAEMHSVLLSGSVEAVPEVCHHWQSALRGLATQPQACAEHMLNIAAGDGGIRFNLTTATSHDWLFNHGGLPAVQRMHERYPEQFAELCSGLPFGMIFERMIVEGLRDDFSQIVWPHHDPDEEVVFRIHYNQRCQEPYCYISWRNVTTDNEKKLVELERALRMMFGSVRPGLPY